MLSRVADALFWMSRYLERAEHVARLLDVCVPPRARSAGRRHGPDAARTGRASRRSCSSRCRRPPPDVLPDRLSPLADVRSRQSDEHHVVRLAVAVERPQHPRHDQLGDMWRELNKLYWQLSDPTFRGQARESPHEFYQAVESGSHVPGDLRRDARRTTRAGSSSSSASTSSAPTRRCAFSTSSTQLLATRSTRRTCRSRICSGRAVLEAAGPTRRISDCYVGRVEPERVVEFLLLHPTFPRSVRFAWRPPPRRSTADRGRGSRHAASVAPSGCSAASSPTCATSNSTSSPTGGLHSFLSTALGALRPGEPGDPGAVFAAMTSRRE